MSITITLSHDKKALLSLRDGWIDLQTRSCTKSMELTWQGIHIYCQHHSGELWLMTAHEDNRLIGIAPLMKVEQLSEQGSVQRQVEFIGASIDQEHLDFIIEPGYEEQVIPLFIDKLYEHKSKWDVICLTGLCDTTTATILQRSNHDWMKFPEKDMIAPYMTLPDTTDDWMMYISRNHRKKLRRYQKELNEQFPDRWSITQVSEPDELDKTFDDLVYLHQAHWESMGEPGTFHNKEKIAYYRELAHCMLKNGWLRMYRLDIDGKPGAVNFCYHYQGRAYNHFAGVERDMVKTPLGHVVTHHSIDQAIHEGLAEFTFMWGQQSWKYSFGGVDRMHHAYRLISNPRIRLQVKTMIWLRRIKSRVHIRSRISRIKSLIKKLIPSTTMKEADTD